MPPEDTPHRSPTVTILPVVAVAVALALVLLPRLDDPFGPSHDGFNAAVWQLGADEIREDGLVGSGLGARRDVLFDVYAGHPPALAVGIWAVQGATGSQAPWTVRILPFAATLASLALLARLAAGTFGPGSAVVAAAAFAGTAMVHAFGAMADTWIVGLPFGVWILLLGGRGRLGGRSAAVAAFLATVVSWQGALLAGLAVLAWGRRGWRDVLGAACGVAAGGLAITAWLAQVGFDALAERAARRVPSAADRAVHTQLVAAAELLGPLLVLAALGLLLSRRKHVEVVAVSVLAPLLYLVLFQAGAAGHRYWLYWATIPVALGVAALADRVRPILLVTLIATVGLVAVLWPSTDQRSTDAGAELAAALAPLEPPATQAATYVVSTSSYHPWLVALWGRPVLAVPSVAAAPEGQVVITDADARGCRAASFLFVCTAP